MTDDFLDAQNTIVVGLGFGDEAKGATVEYLSRVLNADNVIRFSGGAQAAHAVVLPNGDHHVFAQFGSGYFNGVTTMLSEHMMVNLFNLIPEAKHLEALSGRDPFLSLHISETCLLTTPIHEAANHARERARGSARHGSTGLGIGETRSFSLKHPLIAPRIYDLMQFGTLGTKLDMLRKFLEAELGPLDAPSTEEILNGYSTLFADKSLSIVSDHFILDRIRDGVNVFEGSQGTLLDEWYGFHPHTTWSTVTNANAKRLISSAGVDEKPVTVGVTRTYTTRHGHGPFPTELTDEKSYERFPERHNAWGEFQGGWRVGDLDLPLLNYAARINQVDAMAVSHLDSDYTRAAVRYEGLNQLPVATGSNQEKRAAQIELTDTLNSAVPVYEDVTGEADMLARIEKATGAPVIIGSYGPTWKDKKYLG